jgi:type IX secretion system PorP/SprF family membrane protein
MDYESLSTANVGAGAYLKGTRYLLSLSVPTILSPERLQEQNGNAFLRDDRVHANLSGGYDFILSENIDVKPLAILRKEESSPVSLELTGILDFRQKFELGTSYSYDARISGLFLFNVSNGFKIGYAYEMAIENQINGLDNGTYELFMRIGL